MAEGTANSRPARARQRPEVDQFGTRKHAGITQIEKGVFRVRVYARRDAITGTSVQVERTVHGGIRDALDKQAELRSDAHAGKLGGKQSTVGMMLDAWLADCKQRIGKKGKAGLAQNTVDNYDLQVRTLTATELAKVRLDRLSDASSVENTYAALEKALGPARMVQVHKALRQAFNFAMSKGWIGFNPAALVKVKPSPPRSHRPTPTREQVDKAIRLAPAVPAKFPDIDAFLAVAALSGLRRQALCGLRWPDIDLDAQLFKLRRWINMVGGHPVVVDYAKHRRADDDDDREPPTKHLDARLVSVLTELRARQKRRAAESGTRWTGKGWVFSADGMGRSYMRPDTVGRLVSKVTDAAGIKSAAGKRAVLHSFRHHRGSQLVADGVDPATAAAELDHRSLSFFLDTYVHPVRGGVDARLAAVGSSYELPIGSPDSPGKKADDVEPPVDKPAEA